MIEQEQIVIEKLIQMFPEESEFVHERKGLEERWARHILSKHASASYDIERIEKKDAQLDSKTKKFVKAVSKELRKLIKSNSARAIDFSIALTSMELYAEGLSLLKSGPNSPQKDWLNLELLFRSERYIDCLQAIDDLQRKYGDDYETTFATCYIKSRVLWQLGYASQAVDLLQSIVNIRPNYRSAYSILSEWRETRK